MHMRDRSQHVGHVKTRSRHAAAMQVQVQVYKEFIYADLDAGRNGN
jgi:hypothetical protein